VIVLNETRLRRIFRAYLAYDHRSPHDLALAKTPLLAERVHAVATSS
jgi:hypothetical protein